MMNKIPHLAWKVDRIGLDGARGEGRKTAKSMMNRLFTNSTMIPGTPNVNSHSVSEPAVEKLR
jgi:hypothetical protein